jgi:hypothetical protein
MKVTDIAIPRPLPWSPLNFMDVREAPDCQDYPCTSRWKDGQYSAEETDEDGDPVREVAAEAEDREWPLRATNSSSATRKLVACM